MYRVFRARVTDVAPIEYGDDRKGRVQVYITPINLSGTLEDERPAQLPNIIPNSSLGSGITSHPEVGQECIVSEDEVTGQVYILSYVVPPGMDTFGDYVEANVPAEGGTILKVGGYENAIVELSRGGIINLTSNEYADFRLDGTEKRIEMTSRSSRRDWYGGAEVVNFNDDGSEETDYIFCFKTNYENPGFSDWEAHEPESSIGIPSVLPYIDKTVIRAGKILNLNDVDQACGHVYEVQTRQSTGSDVTAKDTVSVLRVGYQDSHTRYDSDIIEPAGSLLDWRIKRNTLGRVNSFMLRYGALEAKFEDSVTGLVTEDTEGEIYRLQIYEGMNGNVPFGMSIYDSVGEGQGYDYGRTDALQKYLVSFGELVDDSSLYREVIEGNNVNYGLILGGSDYARRLVVSENRTLSETFNSSSYRLDTSNGAGIENRLVMADTYVNVAHTVQGKTSRVRLEDDLLEIYMFRNNESQTKLEFKDEGAYLEYDREGNQDYMWIHDDDVELGNRSGSYLSINEDFVSIQSSDHQSGPNIGVDGDSVTLVHGSSSIELDNDGIVLTGGSLGNKIEVNNDGVTLQTYTGFKLELTATNLKVNGKSVVLDTFLSWLASASNTLGIAAAPGAPVPMFPSAQVEFQIKNSIPLAVSPVGFKS